MNPTGLGITGTRNQMTPQQFVEATSILKSLRNKYFTLHHGACIGADETLVVHAAMLVYTNIVAHPPVITQFMSEVAMNTSTQQLPPKEYLERNHDIVDATAMLLACPLWPEDVLGRSGTWSTIRYARSLKRPIIIVYDNGEFAQENMKYN